MPETEIRYVRGLQLRWEGFSSKVLILHLYVCVSKPIGTFLESVLLPLRGPEVFFRVRGVRDQKFFNPNIKFFRCETLFLLLV